MGTHFSAVGVPLVDDASFDTVMRHVLKTAVWETSTTGEPRVGRWSDNRRSRNGATAEVDLLLKDNSLWCAKPQFAGRAEQRVRPRRLLEERGCPGCSVLEVELLDENGQMQCPIAFLPRGIVANRDAYTSWVSSSEPATAHLTFVVEHIHAHHLDLDAYYADQAEGQPPFSPEALIPVGLFPAALTDEHRPPPTAALVRAHLVVEEARRRFGGTFGHPYWHLQARSLGMSFDAVVDSIQLPEVAPGNVLTTSSWVCGSLPELSAEGS